MWLLFKPQNHVRRAHVISMCVQEIRTQALTPLRRAWGSSSFSSLWRALRQALNVDLAYLYCLQAGWSLWQGRPALIQCLCASFDLAWAALRCPAFRWRINRFGGIFCLAAVISTCMIWPTYELIILGSLRRNWRSGVCKALSLCSTSSVCAIDSLFIQFSPVCFVVSFIAFGGISSRWVCLQAALNVSTYW